MSKVLYEKRGEIAYITLNRPDKRNAIDTETDELLFEAWTRFRDDPEVRLAVLTGSGDKAFCAGADLSTHVEGWLEGGPGLGRGGSGAWLRRRDHPRAAPDQQADHRGAQRMGDRRWYRAGRWPATSGWPPTTSSSASTTCNAACTSATEASSGWSTPAAWASPWSWS